jgi:hypothetical protein
MFCQNEARYYEQGAEILSKSHEVTYLQASKTQN